MIKPQYPKQVAEAMARLENAGHSAYLVGGALRDALLSREAHDFDVTTSALPEDMERVFAGYPVIETGLKHGTLTVLIDGYPIEITTFRIDGEYRDARHPEGVTFTDRVEGDLARRDFTVNAMAYNETRGLVDEFGGREDLAAGILRAVGDPNARFSEDALRILRAFRFMSKLGFKIEENTLAATRACREGLSRISAERITAELCGLFEGKSAATALAAMKDCGIFGAIAPDFKMPMDAIGQINALPAVFEVRFVYFLRDCADGGESLIRHLRLSGASLSRVRRLLELRNFDLSSLTEERVRRLLAAAGRYAHDLDALVAVGGFFNIADAHRDTVLAMMAEIRARGDCLTLDGLAVDGRALMNLGLRGRDIGTTLTALLDRVLAEPSLNQRERLLSMAEEIGNGKL